MAPKADDFNTDELEAPEWLNIEFFTQVLRESENDPDIVVTNLKLSPATVKGDHYASVMFRAAVEYTQRGVEKQKSLVLKTMPEIEGHKKEMLQESHLFETEIAMYTKVIPKFEKILKEAGEEIHLGAPYMYHSLSPKKVIIFEDVCPKGYAVLRNREMTLDETKAALYKLAKWHAVSYKLVQEDPDYFTDYRHSILDLPNMAEQEFSRCAIDRFVEMLDETPSLQKYKPYFEPLIGKLMDLAKASFTEYRENPQEGAYYVLCHGDFHSKNMMFKHNPTSGSLEDVMLLDYQLSYVGPIVNDFIYSFIMLMSTDLRLNHFDELLYYYFENLVKTLKMIGYEGPMPKLIELREQLIKHKYWELFLLVTFLPFWAGFREGNSDVDAMMDSLEYRRSLYKGSAYQKDVHLLLPKYLHTGYFEDL